jgi:hypothetical protein
MSDSKMEPISNKKTTQVSNRKAPRKIGGVLLVLLTFKPSDNSEATNRTSPVIKGGLDVVEKETASPFFTPL